MKDRVFSVSGWGFMLGAGVCALLAVLLASPADVFADAQSCMAGCTVCTTIGPGSPQCMTCMQACRAAATDCTQCTCGLPGGACSEDICFGGQTNCNRDCKCVPIPMTSNCKCVPKP